MSRTISLMDISSDNTSLFSGVAYWRSKTVLSRVKTTVWRSPHSHVGLVYRSSSYDGVPRYAIIYMDEIQGLTTKPLIQFILENKLLELLEIRPIMLSKISSLKYSVAKYFGSQGTMENFDKTNFQTELASMFSINELTSKPEAICVADAGVPAISNIDFVVKALLDSEILTLHELECVFDMDDEPEIVDESNNSVVKLVGQLFSLMGIESQQHTDGDHRKCLVKALFHNRFHYLESTRYAVALPEIDKQELEEYAKERLAHDRKCSSTFLSGMFETTLAEDIILEHVADEIDTTAKAKTLHRETTAELLQELAISIEEYMTFVKDTYKERSSSAEVFKHDAAMSKVMETMGSIVLLNNADVHLTLKYMNN